jgi:hypothetical protein
MRMSGWFVDYPNEEENPGERVHILADDRGRHLARIESFLGDQGSHYLWCLHSLDTNYLIRIGPHETLEKAKAHAERLLVDGTAKYDGAALSPWGRD